MQFHFQAQDLLNCQFCKKINVGGVLESDVHNNEQLQITKHPRLINNLSLCHTQLYNELETLRVYRLSHFQIYQK